MPLREVSELLYPSVSATVASLDIDREGKDAAMAKAALRIARVIDETSDAKQRLAFAQLMPELRAILNDLGASPAARAALGKGKPANDKPSGLAKLREARSA